MPRAVLCLLACAHARGAKNTTLNVGMFFRMTSSSGGDMGSYWRAVAAAGLLAVKQFNTRNDTIVADFGNLSGCDIQFNPVMLDTGSLAAPTAEQCAAAVDGRSGADRAGSLPCSACLSCRRSALAASEGMWTAKTYAHPGSKSDRHWCLHTKVAACNGLTLYLA